MSQQLLQGLPSSLNWKVVEKQVVYTFNVKSTSGANSVTYLPPPCPSVRAKALINNALGEDLGIVEDPSLP